MATKKGTKRKFILRFVPFLKITEFIFFSSGYRFGSTLRAARNSQVLSTNGRVSAGRP